jgi:ubiquinone/menaquinone biosynthesis C-methylase UbiE
MSEQHEHGWRFPPERRHVLNAEERWEELQPAHLLALAGVAQGHTAIDVGAGTGFWIGPLIAAVGPSGKVYAADIEPLMLDDLRELVSRQNLSNVEVVQSGEASVPLPDAVADIALMSFVLHEPPDPAAFLRETARLLQPTGRLLLVEWHKKETEKGPPVEHRIAEEEALELLRTAGFSPVSMKAPSDDMYVFVAARLAS